MNKVTVTLVVAIRLLTEVVEEFGHDHVASGGGGGCTYTQTRGGGVDGLNALRPVCIIGQVLNNLGILRAALNEGSGENAACVPDHVIWHNAETMGVTVDDEAQEFFRAAQFCQDNGDTWGTALRTAVDQAQESALRKVRETHPAFGDLAHNAKSIGLGESPLADWERELLNGQ